MSTTSRVALRLAATGLVTVVGLVGLVASASPALAHDIVTTDPSGTTIAADPGPRAAASIPRGIVVTDPNEQPVVLTAKGLPTQRKPRPGTAPATFRDLRAGTTYTVYVGGKVLSHVTAVDRPAPATRLVVSTATTPDAVGLTWRHAATTATGGKRIAYDVSAKPASGKAISKSVTGTHATSLTGLDPHALYTFSVTPRNSAGKGRATVASMTRSLADITGVGAEASQARRRTGPSRRSEAPGRARRVTLGARTCSSARSGASPGAEAVNQDHLRLSGRLRRGR